MKQSELHFSNQLGFIAKALDTLGIACIGYFSYVIYHHQVKIPDIYFSALLLSSLLVLILFPNFGLYSSWRGKNKIIRCVKIFYAWGCVLSCLLIFSFFIKISPIFSRVWFLSWSLGSLFYLNIYRLIVDQILKILRTAGINRKSVAIFGAGQVGFEVINRLKADHESGFDVFCFFDDNKNLHGMKIADIEIHSPEHLLTKIERCHELWIALPLRAESRVLEILFQTRHLTTTVRYIPDIYNFRLLNHRITQITNIPMIEINGTPLTASGITLKRMEDVIFASLILVLISPVMLIIALVIKFTSQGPIIYKQERHGWNGKTIKVYKFRSMYVSENSLEFVQAKRNDNRITPVGNFLRKSSLDELPQFLNVLQGRMSVVGPRPHAISMNHDYKDKVSNYMQRHKVKPGITGWAQVNGFRGETDTLDKMEKRIEYDLFYIQNWSLSFDIKIVFLTVVKGFFGKNAY